MRMETERRTKNFPSFVPKIKSHRFSLFVLGFGCIWFYFFQLVFTPLVNCSRQINWFDYSPCRVTHQVLISINFFPIFFSVVLFESDDIFTWFRMYRLECLYFFKNGRFFLNYCHHLLYLVSSENLNFFIH